MRHAASGYLSTIEWDVQALAFDFDGLILDTETPELTVWTQVFAEHGQEIPPGFWTGFMGRGAEQEMERPHQLLGRLTGKDFSEPAVAASRRARILALIDEEQIRPGIAELIEEAKGADIPIGVASSSKHDWVDRYLQRLGLQDDFAHVVCADDVARAKPFPDLYLELCRRLGAAPMHTIALEDSPNGATAAKAAGLFTIAVPNSVTAPFDFGFVDARIDDLSQVRIADLDRLLKQRSK